MVTQLRFTTADIEAMFLCWLDEKPIPLTFDQLQPVVAESDTPLPDAVCERQELPPGTTVGHAARTTLVVYSEGVEYRLNTRIDFTSESESLRWWRKNRNNPDRVDLQHVGGGKWTLEVAPLCPPESRRLRPLPTAPAVTLPVLDPRQHERNRYERRSA